MNVCVIASLLLCLSTQFFSSMHRKCVLGRKDFQISSLKIHQTLRYDPGFAFGEGGNGTEEVQYEDLEFLYIEYVGAGGSGEAYLVEDEASNKLKIVKRFFKNKPVSFAQENYIMKKMNYEISWHYQDNRIGAPTLAAYQSRDSITLQYLELETADERALVLYKICKELERSQQSGIIHHDIKMGNILISSTDPNMKLVDLQLIDWNLASVYYPGYESSSKKGTQCYYSPELLLRTSYLTPATDIWSLGVVYFLFITGVKPFTVSCKQNGLEAVISLVGTEAFLQMYEKYQLHSSVERDEIAKIRKNADKFKGISLRDRIPPEQAYIFSEELIDLFQKMLTVDPEYRITITQMLRHPYFDRIKRLPPMYQEKKKSKGPKAGEKTPHAPANNLVTPDSPPHQ